jgi:hypothetical protein
MPREWIDKPDSAIEARLSEIVAVLTLAATANIGRTRVLFEPVDRPSLGAGFEPGGLLKCIRRPASFILAKDSLVSRQRLRESSDHDP